MGVNLMKDYDVIELVKVETNLLSGEGVSEEEILVFCEKHGLEEEQVRCCILAYALLAS